MLVGRQEEQQNPSATVAEINGGGTGRSTLWQPHLPVNATSGQPAYPGGCVKQCLTLVCFIVIRAVERLIFFSRANRAINYFNRALTR